MYNINFLNILLQELKLQQIREAGKRHHDRHFLRQVPELRTQDLQDQQTMSDPVSLMQ